MSDSSKDPENVQDPQADAGEATATYDDGPALSRRSEYVSKHRFARMSARKGRYVVDLVRGMPANDAMHLLEHNSRRAAFMIRKVLKSAIANASQDPDCNVNRLRISRAMVDDGGLLQHRLRWRPGPQGRAMPFKRRMCHITLVLTEDE